MLPVWRTLGVGGVRGTGGVDLILAVDSMSRTAFLDQGVKGARVEAVGSPEFDDLAVALRRPLPPQEEQALRDRLGLAPGRPVVFFVHQDVLDSHTGLDLRRFIRDVLPAIRTIGGTFMMKFHPRSPQRPEVWRRWAAAEHISPAEVVFLRDECTTQEASRLCAVCVVCYSTVAYEALLCGKPLVLIHYFRLPHELPFGRRYGAAMDVDHASQLVPAIVQAATDAVLRERLSRGAAEALRQELFGPDGRSADRQASMTLDLMRSRGDRKEETGSRKGAKTQGKARKI
jgi:hypothetical protein